MKQIQSVICLLCMACACLLAFCGCSPTQKTSTEAQTTAADEQETAASTQPQTEPELKTEIDLKSLLGIGLGQQIRQVEGVEVISGRVERVGGSMIYTPGNGGGFFTVNGTIADNSEIVISVHPVGVLRYKLTLNASTEKTVKAEICVYKKGELLVSCSQDEMALQPGANDVDVCIDTGEDSPCDGLYTLQLYLDGVLVKENDFET